MAETQTYDFQSHPSDEQQHPQFQDTVPFEDTFVLDSPLMEETQIVDDSDFSDKTKIGNGMHGYEEEVVLDSEDEELNGSRIVSVKINMFSDRKLGSRREQCCEGQVSSINFAKTGGGKDERSPLHARLNYTGSQEPGDSSQANALDFVDHFVSSNDDLGGSPGTDHRKTFTVKSPPVSSTKGPQRLATRMIKLGSRIEKAKTFEWDDPVENVGIGFLHKNMESPFQFGDCKQISVVARHQKVRHVANEKCISSGDSSKDRKIIQGLHEEIITESEGKIESDSANASGEHLDARSTGLDSEARAIGINTGDMLDIGFNTQIAAEAMEALACGDHPGCNTADVVPGGATENKAHVEHSSLLESDFPNIGGINRNAKRKRSTRLVRRVAASSQKKSQSQDLDPDMAAPSKVTRFFADYGSNSADANGICRESPKPTKHSKLERSAGGSNLRVLENNPSSPISAGHSLLDKEPPQGQCKNDSPVSHQTKQPISGDRLIGTEGGPKGPGERMNNVMEGGILKYTRKKRCLGAHPSGIISGTEGGFNEPVERIDTVKKDGIITYRRKKRIGAKSSCSKVFVSSEGDRSTKASSLKSDMWSHPKRNRTHLNSRRATVFYTPFPIVDGKGSTSHCHERPESYNKGKAQSLSNSCPPQYSINKDSDRTLLALQSGKLDGTDPTSLVVMNTSISVASPVSDNTAPSNSTIGLNVGSSTSVSHEHYRKPCNKNLPKSSLVKELIALGVPESTSDFTWKDLRRRRNMAYVRVLFSQHLDDDIIRQQKKVIARLGLSIASCSMEATHFIADQFARTRNMLEFISLGKPVVTHLWLENCGQANCLISEKSYILRDAKKEKEIGFNMLVSLDCAKRCPLLKGRKVFITPNIKPNKEMMISLVKAVQGQPVEKVKDGKSLENLLILSCEEDHAICLPFLEKGAAVYSSELLLNGVVIQRLGYKRHRLFTTVVKRNRP